MAVLIFLGCLLGGIAIGLPIAWALLLCGAALMFWLDMFDVQIMAQTLVNGADSFSLLAIPFFVLAGEIMNAGGLSKRIVDLPMKLVGHKPGGLGYVGVLAAMIMASLSGSAVADTAVHQNLHGAAAQHQHRTGALQILQIFQRIGAIIDISGKRKTGHNRYLRVYVNFKSLKV